MISFKNILFVSLLLCGATLEVKCAKFLTNHEGKIVRMTEDLSFVVEKNATKDSYRIRIERNKNASHNYFCTRPNDQRLANEEELAAIQNFIESENELLTKKINQEFDQNEIKIDDSLNDFATKKNLPKPTRDVIKKILPGAKRFTKQLCINAAGSVAAGGIYNLIGGVIINATPGLNVAFWCFVGAEVAYTTYIAVQKAHALLNNRKE